MSVGLRLHTTGLKEAIERMKKVGVKLAAHEYLKLIGLHLLEWVDKNFKTEGKAPGRLSPWKKLSPNTIAGRRKGSKKVLQDTGRLKQSFVSSVHKSAQWVEVGTKDKKAPWHHFGTGAYSIKPRGKKFLKFPVAPNARWPKGFAFAKKVRHPGLSARPMIPNERLGYKMAVDVLNSYVDHVLEDAK